MVVTAPRPSRARTVSRRFAAAPHVVPSFGPAWGRAAGALQPAGRRRGYQKRRGLILDLDDTLYPRERFIRSGFAAVANDLQRRHGVPAGIVFKTLSRAFVAGAAGNEFQAVCQQFGLSTREVPYMLRVFRAHKPNLWLPYETGEALRRLRTDGWKLAILTNGLPAVQAAKVDALALAPMVDHVIYAEAVVPGGKPDPAAFEAALDVMELTADRCVVVGDDPINDIAGARNADLRCIRVARPDVSVEPGGEADLVINSVEDLPKVAGGLLEMVTVDVA
jgi:putative hydrolase of the HAD superfamily